MSSFIRDIILEETEILTEAATDGKKYMYIHGIFMQADQKNRNGRIYPKSIMEEAVSVFNNDLVVKNRALGELNHPPRLNIDPAEACHLITELKWDGANVIGKARILEGTPKGAILKGLVEGGVCMGVSSRAAGSVKKNRQGINEVQKDLRFSAVDAVSDPSAPDAFVHGLMEGVSWIYENGIFIQDQGQRIEEAVKEVKNASTKQLEEVKLRLFAEFLGGIK
jgi:hypothetical protein